VTSSHRVLAAAGLWGLLASPPLRDVLESRLVLHMAQFLLLTMVGILIGRAIDRTRPPGSDWNRYGISGLLLALVTALLWLLPISLDRALDHAAWEVVKFLSLPLLLGLPLARSWPHLPTVARGAIHANVISMLIVMGWLYLQSPSRLCNNYLINDQQLFGQILIVLAAGLAAYWTLRAFTGKPADQVELPAQRAVGQENARYTGSGQIGQ